MEIKDFAVENGYDDVKYIGEWKGYKVFNPIIKSDKPLCLGYPLKILKKNDELRISSIPESLEILDYFNAK